jgi:hypothetical protein
VSSHDVDEITADDGRRILIRQLSASQDLAMPFGGENFVGVIWAADSTPTEADRTKVARTLISSGCRYIVSGGVNCEQWHDDADLVLVNLDLQSDLKMPMVMTTWHNGESVEKVAFFAAECASFDDHDFRNYLVLIVGEDSARLACADHVCRAIQGAFGAQQ